MSEKIYKLIALGLNIGWDGTLNIGKLSFTQEEILRHPEFDTLENKISDYIEQM